MWFVSSCVSVLCDVRKFRTAEHPLRRNARGGVPPTRGGGGAFRGNTSEKEIDDVLASSLMASAIPSTRRVSMRVAPVAAPRLGFVARNRGKNTGVPRRVYVWRSTRARPVRAEETAGSAFFDGQSEDTSGLSLDYTDTSGPAEVGRDDLPASLHAWCATTSAGVEATEVDIAKLRRLVDSVVSTAAETSTIGTSTEVRATTSYDDTDVAETSGSGRQRRSDDVWRLLGCAQRTEPSLGSWLASPFFWVAKEAQHECYLLATSSEKEKEEEEYSNRNGSELLTRGSTGTNNVSSILKLAARVTSGWDDLTTGEQWVTRFGKRNAVAVFPFSIVESFLNGAEVSFVSGEATAGFGVGTGSSCETSRTGGSSAGSRGDILDVQNMESRVFVDFGNGAVVGELVTRRKVDRKSKAVTLETAKFENTGTALELITVPSGTIMGALSFPSGKLRARNDANGSPRVPCAFHCLRDGGATELAIAKAGASKATETILAYEKVLQVL